MILQKWFCQKAQRGSPVIHSRQHWAGIPAGFFGELKWGIVITVIRLKTFPAWSKFIHPSRSLLAGGYKPPGSQKKSLDWVNKVSPVDLDWILLWISWLRYYPAFFWVKPSRFDGSSSPTVSNWKILCLFRSRGIHESNIRLKKCLTEKSCHEKSIQSICWRT